MAPAFDTEPLLSFECLYLTKNIYNANNTFYK